MPATRIVKATGKDADGDITSLCNDGEPWSPRGKAGAISDIKGGNIEYRVKSASRPLVHVLKGESGEHLRSTADASTADNLDNLPDC